MAGRRVLVGAVLAAAWSWPWRPRPRRTAAARVRAFHTRPDTRRSTATATGQDPLGRGYGTLSDYLKVPRAPTTSRSRWPLELKVLGDRDTSSRSLTRLRVAHTGPTPRPSTARPSWPAAGSGSSAAWGSAGPAATCWPRPALPAGVLAAGTSTVVKDLGKVRLKGSTSSTAGAVGFLTPPRLPWLGRGCLGGRLTPGDGVGM